MTDVNVNEFLANVDEAFNDDSSELVKKLRKTLKGVLTEKAELAAKVSEFETKEVEQKLGSVWDKLKVPPAIRDFYKGDKDPEAITQWWEASKGFFNVPASEGDKPSDKSGSEADPELAGFSDAANLGSDTDPSGDQAWKAKAKELKNTSANANPKALDEFLASSGFNIPD